MALIRLARHWALGPQHRERSAALHSAVFAQFYPDKCVELGQFTQFSADLNPA